MSTDIGPPTSSGEQALALPALRFWHVARVDVELGDVQELGVVGGRTRRIIPIVGGQVRGARLSGQILAGGADWQWVTPDGVATIDTRYAMQTDDGVPITIATSGYRHGPADVLARLAADAPVSPDQYYFRVTVRFETAAARYDWLNRTVFVAVAAREARRVYYDLYELL